VRVSGFLLPSGSIAALTVAITHPTVSVAGDIQTVSGDIVTVVRASGDDAVLHFPANMSISDTITAQHFLSSQLPAGAHLSVSGVQEAGWLDVSTATLTLKSQEIKGAVTAIATASASFSVSVSTTSSIEIATSSTAEFTVGKDPAAFSTLQLSDVVTVKAYPSPSGDVLATRVEIHRKLLQRTGLVSDLSASGFGLILRDSSSVTVNLQPYTSVLVNGESVPINELLDGEKVRVEGHIAPDGTVDATKIVLDS
jgi:hypothetical protein